VQGGTKFDPVSGTEVGIIKSQKYMTGESGAFSGQTAVPNGLWGDRLQFHSMYGRFNGSAQGSVPIGGGNVAQTYIEPLPGGSTGIFAGNTGQTVNIQSKGQQFDTMVALIGAMPVTAFLVSQGQAGVPQVRFETGFGFRYRYFNTEHSIDQQSLTFPGVHSNIDLKVNSHFFAPNFSFGANVLPSGPSGMFYGSSVFVAPGVLVTNAEATQNSRCNLCPIAEQVVDLSRRFNSSEFSAVVGVDAKFGWQINPSLKIQVEGGYQHTTNTQFFSVPITPVQQPIKLDDGSSGRAHIALSLRYAFSQPPAPPPP
jgi:hypothetical protein